MDTDMDSTMDTNMVSTMDTNMEFTMDTDMPVISEGIDELTISVKNGDLKKVTELLLNKRFSNMLGQNLLSIAVKNGHVAIAEYLLENGCKILNGIPHNELVVAMWRDDVEMIDMLLKNGGDFQVFNLIPKDELLKFGNFARLIWAIKVGNKNDAESSIKKLELSDRLVYEFYILSENLKMTKISNFFKEVIRNIVRTQA